MAKKKFPEISEALGAGASVDRIIQAILIFVQREAFSPEEAADICGFSRATFYNQLNAGHIRAKVLHPSEPHLSSRRTLILRSEILRYLEELPDYVPMHRRALLARAYPSLGPEGARGNAPVETEPRLDSPFHKERHNVAEGVNAGQRPSRNTKGWEQ